jgi:hypothetical protein
LSAPPQSGDCQDGQDSAQFDVLIKDPITSPDPKTPAETQQLGAFEFEVHFDPNLVCVSVAPGSIPIGEMSCFSLAGEGFVRFGCITLSGFVPSPQPPGVLATVTVRPQPTAYTLLFPGEERIVQLVNEPCSLGDLLGHTIKTAESCGNATVRLRRP